MNKVISVEFMPDLGDSTLLANLLQGFILGGTAAAQPGPFQAYLLAQTLSRGWRRALLATLAPLISDGPIVVLVLLFLSQTPSWFLVMMQLAGGLFLLYLARRAFHAFRSESGPELVQPVPERGQRSLLEAALVNALAPGPYLFWATVGGPILLSGWRQSPALGMAFIGGFYLTLIGGFIGFVALFAFAGRLHPRVVRTLNALSVLALLLFGLYQLWSGVTAVIDGSFLSPG